MDREIPKEIRKKERNKKIIRFSAIAVTIVVVISILISLMRTGVKKKTLYSLSLIKERLKSVSVHRGRWHLLSKRLSRLPSIAVLLKSIVVVVTVWMWEHRF